MLILKNKFVLFVLAFLIAEDASPETNTESDQDKPVDVTDFIIIEKIRIPVLTDKGIDFFECDVKITGLDQSDMVKLKSYEDRIRDMLLADMFDSVRALVYEQKSIAEGQINALQRRIWICILKWLGRHNIPIRVAHVDILHAKFFVKKKIKELNKVE